MTETEAHEVAEALDLRVIRLHRRLPWQSRRYLVLRNAQDADPLDLDGVAAALAEQRREREAEQIEPTRATIVARMLDTATSLERREALELLTDTDVSDERLWGIVSEIRSGAKILELGGTTADLPSEARQVVAWLIATLSAPGILDQLRGQPHAVEHGTDTARVVGYLNGISGDLGAEAHEIARATGLSLASVRTVLAECTAPDSGWPVREVRAEIEPGWWVTTYKVLRPAHRDEAA